VTSIGELAICELAGDLIPPPDVDRGIVGEFEDPRSRSCVADWTRARGSGNSGLDNGREPLKQVASLV